jgi:uroporphyrinogen-III synthase
LAAVATVDVAPVYEQVEAVDLPGEVLDRLRRGEMDVVTLTSPNVARAFLAVCDETIRQRILLGMIRLLGNSKRLGDWLREQGFPANVSPDPTMSGLISALVELRHGRPAG